MAQLKMQCQKCERWVLARSEHQVYVPDHGKSTGAIKAKCAGSGKTALDIRGWESKDHHPPSIKKGT